MARLKGDSGQAVVLDAAEIKRLLKISQTTTHGERDQTVVVLSYWLGLRAKELASLRVGDVYLSDGTVKPVLHLKAGYTKRAKMRDVYLSSDKVVRCLKNYGEFLLHSRQFGLRPHASVRAAHTRRGLNGPVEAGASPANPELPLFRTRSNKGFSANGMVILLRHLHQLAGIDGGSSHSGRRTMITRLAEAGVDMKSIATLAEHSSIRTTAALYVENNPSG